MTAIPPHLQRAIDEGRARIVDQPARTNPRPSRATAADTGQATYRCVPCGQEFTSNRQAERHVNQEHHGGRYQIVLDQEGGQQ